MVIDAPIVSCEQQEVDGKKVWVPARTTIPIPTFIHSAQGLLTELRQIANLLEAECNSRNNEASSPVVALPESWQKCLPEDRPQASLIWADVRDDNTIGSSRWQMSIPHYRHPKSHKPVIPDYTKGQDYFLLALPDKSKLFANCKTKQEAERIAPHLIDLVDPTQVDGVLPTFGTRGGRQLNQVKVRAIEIQYFATGQLSLLPDWKISLIG
jgi:hypothetical protein